jgi:hypothetical protein
VRTHGSEFDRRIRHGGEGPCHRRRGRNDRLPSQPNICFWGDLPVGRPRFFCELCRVRTGQVFTRTANSRAGSTLECRDAMHRASARQSSQSSRDPGADPRPGAGRRVAPAAGPPGADGATRCLRRPRSFPPVPARPARLGKTPSRPLGPRCTTVYASGYREPQSAWQRSRTRYARRVFPKKLFKPAVPFLF